jgi:hypothetical protein
MDGSALKASYPMKSKMQNQKESGDSYSAHFRRGNR